MYNQKVAAVKRLKKESMYGLSAKKWPLHKGGRCTKVAVVERSWAPNENIVHCLTYFSI